MKVHVEGSQTCSLDNHKTHFRYCCSAYFIINTLRIKNELESTCLFFKMQLAVFLLYMSQKKKKKC